MFRKKAIVTNTGDDTLSVISLIDRKVEETISLKEVIENKNNKIPVMVNTRIGPYDMYYNNEGYLYCTNAYGNSVSKIDMENREIKDILSVGSFPTCIKSFQDRIFVCNSDSNSISIISKKQFSLIESIQVGERPIDMEMDIEYMKLYVANSNSYGINVIDLIEFRNKVVKLKHNPINIILGSEYMYILSIANNGMDNMSNVSIMDRKTHKVKESMNLNGIFNSMLRINNGEIVFITGIDNGCLYRMDMKNGNVLNKVHLRGMPNKLAWDGKRMILITNISMNVLTLFDVDTNEIITNIEVGEEPNSILVIN